MLSTQHKFSIGYSLLTILGVLLIHTVFFAPQSENLSYHDFKTLLKAGKILDLTLGERIITGRLTIDGLDGLLPLVQMEAFRKFG
jgi:cell division protease FtsH